MNAPASRVLSLLLDAIDREHDRARREALEAEAAERGFDINVVRFNLDRREWLVPEGAVSGGDGVHGGHGSGAAGRAGNPAAELHHRGLEEVVHEARSD